MKTQTLFQIALTIALAFILTSGKVDKTGISESTTLGAVETALADEQLNIEPWMVNDDYWNPVRHFENDTASEQNAMEIESWMTDDSLWRI